MHAGIAGIAALADGDIAALAPLPRQYAAIYSCVAWPYWFGDHAAKPLRAQLRRLQETHPHLRRGAAICAAISAAPRLPPGLWRRIHAFAGDDLLATVRLAIAVAKRRHAG